MLPSLRLQSLLRLLLLGMLCTIVVACDDSPSEKAGDAGVDGDAVLDVGDTPDPETVDLVDEGVDQVEVTEVDDSADLEVPQEVDLEDTSDTPEVQDWVEEEEELPWQPALLDLDFAPVWGIPNIDDDNENQRIDWEDNATVTLAGDNEIIWRTIAAAEMEKLVGTTLHLRLDGAVAKIRIHLPSGERLGAGGATSTTLMASSEDFVFGIEFNDFLVEGLLTFELVDAEETVHQSVVLPLRAAPLVLNHHLQPSERLWVMSFNAWGINNTSMVNDLKAVLGDQVSTLSGNTYDYDVWVQDEIEFATLTDSEGHRVDLVIDSIRDGHEGPGSGLDPFPENELLAPDVVVRTWGTFNINTVNSQDSFGNLEVSPPVTVNGVTYPFGRIYYGDSGPGWRPATALRNMLSDQKIQAPVTYDIDWLCVGHVDEFMSFIPDPTAPKGFRLLYADVDLAWELLDTLSGTAQLPRYSDHGINRVSQITGSNSLKNLNNDIQRYQLTPTLVKIKADFGLDEQDIIRLPALFMNEPQCGAASLIPGTVNLVVYNKDDGTTHLFAPDPFFRSNLSDKSSDPVIADIEARLPGHVQVHWLDNWDVYHMGLGEVHCGTNVMRTPVGEWWVGTEHLIGGVAP